MYYLLLILYLISGVSAPGQLWADPGSGSNYVNIQNDRPVPANFLPYAPDSIWYHRLPENPQNVDATNSTRVKNYARNSSTVFYTPANNGYSGCAPGAVCAGRGGYPTYLAKSTDPTVTIDCSLSHYGCSYDSLTERVSSIPGTFHIPANARPGCNDQAVCGDINLTVIQPDGTELEMYGCSVARDWRDGDVIGGAVCKNWVSAIAVNHVVTGHGLNATVDGGDNFLALNTFYNEVVPAGASIRHALEIRVTCTTGVVYPGAPLTECASSNPGIPSGSLIHLKLSHAEIDAAISAGTLKPQMRPFLYALHDYGAYVFDGGGENPSFQAFDQQPRIEEASPWIINGGTNPWVPWFQALGAELGTTSSGNPMWRVDVDLYNSLANSFEILSSCYARGTCSDSIPTTPEPSSVCDVNQSGSFDVLDVQLAANQAVGKNTCLPAGQSGSADINHDGNCSVVDVLRVANTALGADCNTHP